MSWTTSTDELRQILSDGPTDKYRFRKRVFGELNGVNTIFKTLEFRRVTNFTTSTSPLTLWQDGVPLTSLDVASDHPATGQVSLVVAPLDGSVLEASYYVQWFLDSELDAFLVQAARWLGVGSTPANIPDGLTPSALAFAAAQAYQKMAMRWQEWLSAGYRLEDALDESTRKQVEEFIKLAETKETNARKLRDDYYTRQGQSNAPLFNSVLGNIRNPVR